MMIGPFTARKRSKENSSPMEKSSSTMPISASSSISSPCPMTPKPWGPMAMPTARKPITVGSRSLWKAKTVATVRARTVTRLVSMLSMPGADVEPAWCSTRASMMIDD